MTLLPGTNYMSNSARTDAEMQVALDKVNEVIAEIGSKDVTTLTISSGTLTTPLSSMVSIASEGGVGVADTLATIGVSNIDKGRMVILQHANSAEDESTGITITHGAGAGAIQMKDSMSFILCSKRMLGLIYTGATGRWQEVWRGYGRSTAEEKLAERTDIGLGDASVETIATGGDTASKVLKVSETSLITNNVLKINADGQIEKALVADLGGGNAATLENNNAASFVRTNASAAQSIDADLTVVSANANLIADGTTTAALRLKASGGANERAFVEMTASDGELVVGTQTAGGVGTPSIRLNPGGAANEKLEYAVDGSTWQSLTPGAGNGLHADILDGAELTDVWSTVAPQLKKIVFLTSNVTNFATEATVAQMTDIAYPVPPNGARRFLLSLQLTVSDSAGYDGDRDFYMRICSGTTSGGSGDRIFNRTIDLPNGSLLYTNRIHDFIYTPAAGDQLTVVVGIANSDHSTDLIADDGEGSLKGLFYSDSSTDSSYDRKYPGHSRTYLMAEYLDG